jgi:hypothetical protein
MLVVLGGTAPTILVLGVEVLVGTVELAGMEEVLAQTARAERGALVAVAVAVMELITEP